MPGSQRRASNTDVDPDKAPLEGDVLERDEPRVDDGILLPPRSERRRVATLADLTTKKRPRTSEAVLTMKDEDGEVTELVIKLVAITGKEYDALVAEFPPTRKQRDRAFATGQTVSFDIDSFAPELISRCAAEPKIPLDTAKEIWETWSGGESGGLYMECQRLCQGGLDIPFTVAG
jgi:hypothetical protein